MKRAEPTIIHLRASTGGIAAYGERIEAIYEQAGFAVEIVTVDAATDYQALLSRLNEAKEALCHFEIGAGDGPLLSLSRRLLRNGRPQLATIHDPGVVVWNPITVTAAASHNGGVRFAGKVWRRLLGRTYGATVVRRQLSDPHLNRLYLRPDLATEPHSYYLPQPTYHAEAPALPAAAKTTPKIGYSGYWGLGKGLETLLDAIKLLRATPETEFDVVIEGSTADPADHYASVVRDYAHQADPQAELIGLIGYDGFDSFLQSLAVLVLPYWPELPNGTSSMAMRAAELALPIIASDTPALKGQLGDDGAVYVSPKDPEALKNALVAFLNDSAAARKRAEATQKRIFVDHNWKVVGQQLTKIVDEVTK
jgi:glycosyltransferase involved in cell wall biosynthesis